MTQFGRTTKNFSKQKEGGLKKGESLQRAIYNHFPEKTPLTHINWKFLSKATQKLVFFEGAWFLLLLDTVESLLSTSFDLIFSSIKTRLKKKFFQQAEKQFG